jgi:AmmeMemoRadiSam system protein A
MTADADRRRLLQIARDAVSAHVRGEAAVAVTLEDHGTGRRCGAFVTVHIKGNLRGCIGRLDVDEPATITVARCAASACSADPRFRPVTEAELAFLGIEVSLLGALEQILGPDDIDVGRHGVLVEWGRRRGLLLPQVATERRWDSFEFLAQTCRKAGLPRDGWKQGAQLWRFEAEVFSDAI